MLTYAEKSKIARDTVLGVPGGEESEEAKAYRAEIQKDADLARQNGYQLDPPWDWDDNDGSGHEMTDKMKSEVLRRVNLDKKPVADKSKSE